MSKVLHNGKWWWGYLDDTGVVRVLPYTDDAIIERTERLPFCRGIFDPFTAPSKTVAQYKIAEFLSEEARKEATKNSFTQQFISAPETTQ